MDQQLQARRAAGGHRTAMPSASPADGTTTASQACAGPAVRDVVSGGAAHSPARQPGARRRPVRCCCPMVPPGAERTEWTVLYSTNRETHRKTIMTPARARSSLPPGAQLWNQAVSMTWSAFTGDHPGVERKRRTPAGQGPTSGHCTATGGMAGTSSQAGIAPARGSRNSRWRAASSSAGASPAMKATCPATSEATGMPSR